MSATPAGGGLDRRPGWRRAGLPLAALWIAASTVWTVPGTATRPDEAWRGRWRLVLTADPGTGVPETLTLHAENRGDRELVGADLLLSFYRDGSLIGWGYDPSLREEEIRIPPGATAERTLRVADLEFLDRDGRPLPAEGVDLHAGTWRVSATLADRATPRPEGDSSPLVWSTSVRFGPGD